MNAAILRPALLLAVLGALAACDRGSTSQEPAAPANTAVEAPAPPPPPVEAAPAVKPANVTTADERRRAARAERDGPGEESTPEYAGSRSAATALPSQGDDAPPPSPAPAPAPSSSPGPQG